MTFIFHMFLPDFVIVYPSNISFFITLILVNYDFPLRFSNTDTFCLSSFASLHLSLQHPLSCFPTHSSAGPLESPLAYEIDAELEYDETDPQGAQHTPHNSSGSVTTPPAGTKRVPFFKKVTPPPDAVLLVTLAMSHEL